MSDRTTDPLKAVLDAHLPALLNHLWDAMEPAERKPWEDLTPTERSIRLAYSEAHWIASTPTTPTGAEVRRDAEDPDE